jgi:hypothetical protein
MNQISFLLKIKHNIENQLLVIDNFNSIRSDINKSAYDFSNISDILHSYVNQISNNILIQKQHKLLLNKIDFFLLKNCKHEWENDIIELQNEYMKPIKYCLHCHLNAN